MTSTKYIPTLDGNDLRLLGPWPKGDSAFVSVAALGHQHFRLDRDGARALRDALSSAIEERDAVEHPAPTRPTFAVGDRVEITYGHARWDGPGTVTEVYEASVFGPGYSVKSDASGLEGFFDLRDVIALPTPDYAALAATFKPGDTAMVSDNPGYNADGSGFVHSAFNGRAVNVIESGPDDNRLFGDEVVRVRLGEYGHTNSVHVAHLTRAIPDPA